MKLQERMEKFYLLNLLRYANTILNEIQYNEFVLPSQFGANRKQLLFKGVVSSPKQDKSALAKV